MPFDIAAARAKKERTLSVDIEGETASVTYQPAAFTIGLMAELRDAMRTMKEEEDEGGAGLADMRQLTAVLDRLLVRWDLELDGEVIPTTAAAMENLDLFILIPIGEALMDDIKAGKAPTTSNGASAAGSSTRASTRRSARTGTRTSSS